MMGRPDFFAVRRAPWVGLKRAAVIGAALLVGMASSASASTPTWQRQPSPNVPGGSTHLLSVACRRAASCIAVGHSGRVTEPRQLVEQWDGAHWRIVTT